jgi:hypothetical protein
MQASGQCSASARAVVVITLILPTGIANISLAVANVARPDIGAAFKASQTALDLVAVAYSLGLASSVLYLGDVGDRYGRRLLLVLGSTHLGEARLGRRRRYRAGARRTLDARRAEPDFAVQLAGHEALFEV